MSDSSSGRNLLVGFLALQNGLISPKDMIAATSLWIQERSQPFERLLVDHEFITEQQRDILMSLVEMHLRSHDGNTDRSLADLDALPSLRGDLQALGDPDVQNSIDRAMRISDADTDMSLTASWSRPVTVGRYHVLRVHAKGGLGVVSVARDTELNREVAFKEIQDEFAQDEIRRARFVREAEITGGLEHPGIVPVYGLGQYDDGRPYYAMRLVKGESLREAIRSFHQQDDRSRAVPGMSFELRRLLRRFVDVCNAVEYAHSRGILHRDLKPANVMLGKYGETLVVDWGLAKGIGRDPRRSTSDEDTLWPTAASSSDTRAGSVFGTPSYMSPEQASGRLDDMGPVSDVCSLGATLYCILTGHSPFHEDDNATALRKAQGGDLRRPRDTCIGVHPALEAICLKAMAFVPEDRYASASALARDVEHWLADEPVAAHRESWGEQLARFARRNRNWVLAASAAVVLIAATSTVAAILVNMARQEQVRLTNEKAEQLRRANALRLAAQSEALSDRLPQRSLLLAVEAIDQAHSAGDRVPPLAYASLHATLSKIAGRMVAKTDGQIVRLEVSGDENWLSDTGSGSIRLDLGTPR